MPEKITYQDFAKKIKEKYPQYGSLDDSTLTARILDKYPQYAETVDFNLDKNVKTENVQNTEQPQVAENTNNFELSFKEQPKNNTPNYMELFDKKDKAKMANNKGVSLSFAEQVGEAASKAEQPVSFIADARNLSNRAKEIVKYFPEAQNDLSVIQEQLSNINQSNINQVKEFITGIENKYFDTTATILSAGGERPIISNPQRSEYERNVVNDGTTVAIKSLVNDVEKLREAAKLKKTSEVEGLGKKVMAFERAQTKGVLSGVEEYIKGYTNLANELQANATITNLNDKIRRLDEGEDIELTTDDKLLLKAISENVKAHQELDKEIPDIYKVGEATGQSLGFMAEFFLSGGQTAIGRAAAKDGVKGAKKIGLGLAVKLAETGIQVPKMPSFYKLTAENVSNGMNFGEAVLDAYWTQGAEVLSEKIFLQNPVGGAGAKSTNQIMQRMGINFNVDKGAVGILKNTLEEAAEEKIGEIMTAPKDYESFREFWNAYTDVEQNKIMLGSVALMTGTMGSVAVAGNSLAETRRKAMVKRMDKFVPSDLRAEIDIILDNKDLSVKQQYDLVGDAISDRIDSGELGEDPTTTTANAMRYMQYRVSQLSSESTDANAVVKDGEMTIGEVEPIGNMQEQVDYLKEKGVDVEGLNGEQVETLYEKTKSEEDKTIIDEAEGIEETKPEKTTPTEDKPSRVVEFTGDELKTDTNLKTEEDGKSKRVTDDGTAKVQEKTVQEQGERSELGTEPENKATESSKETPKADKTDAETEVVNTPQKQSTVKSDPEKKLTEKKTEISETQPTEIKEVAKQSAKKEIVKPEKPKKSTVSKVFTKVTKALNLTGKETTSMLGSTARNGKINGVDVVVQQGSTDNEIIIESMRTPSAFRQRGKATKALQQITEQADKEGITLKLRAVPQKGSKITEAQLKSFYEKNGFVFDGIEGVRKPKEVEQTKENTKADLYNQRVSYTPEGANKPLVGDVMRFEKGKAVVKMDNGKLFEAKPNELTIVEKTETTGQPEVTPTEEKKITKATSIKPKNLRDVYKAGREIFGLNRSQALAQAIIVNTVVNKIAKNRGVTPEKVWSEIEFRKGLSGDARALYQAVWHGSPYEFDKFALDKIGTGEGAQAFGWGLYFTDKKAIAEGYANLGSGHYKAMMDAIRNAKFMGVVTQGLFNKYKPNKAEKRVASELRGLVKSVGLNPNNSDFHINRTLEIIWHNTNNGVFDINKVREKANSDSDFQGRDEYKLALLIQPSINLTVTDPSRNLYKVKLHGDRSIDEFNYLRWDKPVGRYVYGKILDALDNENNFWFSRNVSNDSLGDDVYKSLSRLLGSDKEASLFLLRAGIDGIKYPTESTYKGSHEESFNYVIFDENVAEIEDHIKFQKQGTGKTAKGAIQFLSDGNAIISALTNPNVSTPLHEIAHLYERYMPDSERKAVLKWAKHKTWTTDTSEMFARGFEKYLAEGKAPTVELQKIFDRFKKWLTDIYNGITGSEIDIELNDAMTAIYGQMLGVENVKQAKAKKENIIEYKKTFKDVDDLLFQEGILFQGEDKTEKHTQAVNKLIDNFEKEGIKDISKAVHDYLMERGNPVSKSVINNTLNSRGYAPKFTEQYPIGTTNAKVRTSREMRGLDAIPKADRVANKDLWQSVVNKISNGIINPRQTVKDILSTPLIELETNPTKEAIVKWDRIRILKETKYTVEEIEAKQQANDNTGLVDLFMRKAELEVELEQNDLAAAKIGNVGGSTLQFRQRNLEEDMSLAAMIREAKILNGGKELTVKQEQRFKELSEKFEKLQAEYDRLKAESDARQEQFNAEQEKKRKAAEKKLINDIQNKLIKQTPKGMRDFDTQFKADVKKQKLSQKENDIKERLRDRLARLANVNFAVGEEGSAVIVEELSGVIKDMSELGIVKLEQGIDTIISKVKDYMLSVNKKFDGKNLDKYKDEIKANLGIEKVVNGEYERLITELIDKSQLGFDTGIKGVLNNIVYNRVVSGRETIDDVVDDIYESVKDRIPNITKRKIRDAISGYGEFRKLSKEEVDTKVRELKRQGRLDSAIEDVEEKNQLPLRTGVERDTQTQETRQKQARILKEIKERDLVPPPTEEDQEAQWRNGLQAYQRRLENAIADIEKEIATGERKAKSQAKKYNSPELDSLRTELERLKKVRDAIDKETGRYVEQREQAIIKATERAIAELEMDIDKMRQDIPTDKTVTTKGKGVFGLSKAKKEKVTSERIEELRKLKEALQQQLSELMPDAIKDKALLEKYKNQRQRRLDQLLEQQRTKDYGERPKPYRPTLDKATIEINRKIERLKYDIEKEKETIRINNRSFWQKRGEEILNAWNLPKALKSSFDYSAPFRQGILLISKPKSFTKAMRGMFEDSFSKETYENWLMDLKGTDDYFEMMENDLFLAEPTAILAAKEEHFQTNWLKYIDKTPVYGAARQASERAYVGFLNKIKVDLYLNYRRILKNEGFTGEDLMKEMKGYARVLNIGAGRGKLIFKIGSKEVFNLESIAPVLNMAYFSPRLIASRLAVFNPFFYASLPKRTRMEAIKTYYTSIGVLVGTYVFLSMVFFDDDDVKFEFNPLSSDSWKIKYKNTTFDIFGGFQQVIRTFFQFITGRYKEDGSIKKMEGNKWMGRTRWTTLTSFFNNKLSPTASTIRNALHGGENYEGEKMTVTDEALNLIQPLYIQDFIDVLKEEGLVFAVFSGIPAMFGVGVQTYKPKTKGNNIGSGADYIDVIPEEIPDMSWMEAIDGYQEIPPEIPTWLDVE